MEESKLKQLKQYVELCKSDHSVLSDPYFSFFRDDIESLGGKLPASAYGKSKWNVVDESDEEDEMANTKPHVEEVVEEEEEEEEEVVESDLELEGDTIEPDNDPPQKMGDPTVKVTDENREAAQEAKTQAMEAISEGRLEDAIEHLTSAITLNPTSDIMYATRASVYVKMKKPNAAIRDANAALREADGAVEINPDSGKLFKSRGMARAMLGQWEEAAKDLHVAFILDYEYDEEINAVLKKVEPNAHRMIEHRRKYDRLRQEREERRYQREWQRRWAKAQAAYEKAKEEEKSSSSRPGGMPGGFPGAGGIPGGFPEAGDMPWEMFDPEVVASLHDREVMAALNDVSKNPANVAKHQANPKLAPIIAKVMTKFGG